MRLKQILEKNYTVTEIYQAVGEMREKLEDKAYHGGVRKGTGGEAIEQLGELEEQVENLPRLRLTLAFEPQQEQIRQIGDWVRENVDPEALLDLQLDKNLIAGARISWQGRAADFSLKGKLDTKREQIMNILPL